MFYKSNDFKNTKNSIFCLFEIIYSKKFFPIIIQLFIYSIRKVSKQAGPSKAWLKVIITGLVGSKNRSMLISSLYSKIPIRAFSFIYPYIMKRVLELWEVRKLGLFSRALRENSKFQSLLSN